MNTNRRRWRGHACGLSGVNAALAGAAMILALTCSDSRAQASLTPPGAPAPTLRTLDQVEPRSPISGAGVITQPGSYYLTGNIVTAGHGITIRTNNVTLDLMGFCLAGDRGGSDYGIYVDGNVGMVRSGICIRNGTVTGFGKGVRLEYAETCLLDSLTSVSNLAEGVLFYGANGGTCRGHLMQRCVAARNGYGITLDASNGGRCEGIRILSCTVEENGAQGVVLNGNGGVCCYNQIVSSMIRGNARSVNTDAIAVEGPHGGLCCGNMISGCTIVGPAATAVRLYGTDGECSGNVVENNRIIRTQGNVFAQTAPRNVIVGNMLSETGISASTDSIDTFVLNNLVVEKSPGFSLGANQVYGPVVTASGALSTNGVAAHPWANFQR